MAEVSHNKDTKVRERIYLHSTDPSLGYTKAWRASYKCKTYFTHKL